MWKEVVIEGDRVLGLECSGKLSEDDLERLHAWLDRKLAGAGKPALVIFMDTFAGYESASALWADMKIDTRHGDDFSRVAMVGDQGWIEWGAKVADLVTGADIKWFEAGDRDAAVVWARSGT